MWPWRRCGHSSPLRKASCSQTLVRSSGTYPSGPNGLPGWPTRPRPRQRAKTQFDSRKLGRTLFASCPSGGKMGEVAVNYGQVTSPPTLCVASFQPRGDYRFAAVLRHPLAITTRRLPLAKPPAMTPFDYQPRTRIVFGPGKIEALGELASELGAR